MRKDQVDQLEHYISHVDRISPTDKETLELGGLADEIRALHPVMPQAGFDQRVVEYVLQHGEFTAQPAVRKQNKRTWFKPTSWMSVAAAAVLLVTMGVLPHTPGGELPQPPATQSIIQEAIPDSIPAEVKDTAKLEQQSPPVATETSSTVDRDNTPAHAKQVAIATSEPRSTEPPKEKTTVAGEARQSDAQQAGQHGQERIRVAKSIVITPPSTDEAKLPFRTLAIPNKTPAIVSVNDDPPSVTMVYKEKDREIHVRQWPNTITSAAQTSSISRASVQVVRDDVVAEVSGSDDREALEQFAKELQ